MVMMMANYSTVRLFGWLFSLPSTFVLIMQAITPDGSTIWR